MWVALKRTGCGRLFGSPLFTPRDTSPQCAAEDSATPTAESCHSTHTTSSSKYDGTVTP